MNPVEAVMVNSDFIAEDIAAFVTIAHGLRIFPVQIQNRTQFRAIRNRHFNTLQKFLVFCIMYLQNVFIIITSTRRIHQREDIVRLTHSWAANLVAPSIPLQLPLFRAKQYDLTAIHSFPTNLLSLLCAARQAFYKKLGKTAPLNLGLCHTFLENCYV